MRKLAVLASAFFVVAAPAAAQDRFERAEEDVVQNLPDPGEIDAIGDTLGRAGDALMDVDVGPVVDAVDPGRRLHRGYRELTLGDLVTRDDPYAREHMMDSIEAATIGIGAMVDQIAMLTPALRRSIEESAIRMREAIREGRERSYDRRYGGYDERDPE